MGGKADEADEGATQWKDWVEAMVGTGAVKDAAIIAAKDGAVLASTAGLAGLDPKKETLALVAALGPEGPDYAHGMALAGEKFVVQQCEVGRVVRGRKGPVGVIAYKTQTVVVLGLYDENKKPPQKAETASSTLQTYAEHLVEAGL